MATLLIIGGSGFFGKSFLDGYKRGILNKWEISSIKIIARGASNLANLFPDLVDETVELISSDISLMTEIPIADYVIHAAASTNAASYLTNPHCEKRNIIKSVTNYCKLATIFHQNSRILYVSSGAVYGQQPAEIHKIREDFIWSPVDVMDISKQDYAIAKRESEEEIRALGMAGYRVSIARCFSFVGPYLPLNQHFAIGNFIRDGMAGIPIHVKSKHVVYRSYMYADDLVLWLMSIVRGADFLCPTVNVGSDEQVSVVELADMIGEKFGLKVLKPNIDLRKVDRYVPSIQKAKDIFNLDISVGLNDAVNETIRQIQKSCRD